MDLFFRSAEALAIIGLLLLGLWWVVRLLSSGRLIASTRSRLVSVVESTFLAQNTTIHVVKIANRYFLVGGGAGGVSLISEVESADVEPYIEAQRQALSGQAARLTSLWKNLRPRR